MISIKIITCFITIIIIFDLYKGIKSTAVHNKKQSVIFQSYADYISIQFLKKRHGTKRERAWWNKVSARAKISLVSSHGECYANEYYRFIFASTRCRRAKIDAEFVREADLYRDV